MQDLTGRVTAWIEIGMPDADRLNKAAKAAPRVAVYTHRNPETLQRQLAGQRIHRAGEVEIHAFDPKMIEAACQLLDRRTALEVSVTGGHLYLTVGNRSFDAPLAEHRISQA